jgi:hypothetical protein
MAMVGNNKTKPTIATVEYLEFFIKVIRLLVQYCSQRHAINRFDWES